MINVSSPDKNIVFRKFLENNIFKNKLELKVRETKKHETAQKCTKKIIYLFIQNEENDSDAHNVKILKLINVHVSVCVLVSMFALQAKTAGQI